MNLNDKIWKDLEGGYRLPYDVSIPLKELEQTSDPEVIKKIWSELWNELHHQGDVGLASYLAIPQLVRIGMEKNLFDWNLLALCTVIEQERHSGNNEPLPPEFHNYYNQGLEDLNKFVLKNLNHDMDDTTYVVALATLATCTGRIQLGKAISNLEDQSTLDEFLEQF